MASVAKKAKKPERAEVARVPSFLCYAVILSGAVFLAYQPAWHGQMLWDDDVNLVRPELQSWNGLRRIWCEPGATQQYYPLDYTLFWIGYKLFGYRTLGYHLLSLLLHSTAAVMAALVLRRLAIPGAWLAAAIFALHPVQVESVAWISEMKNTLSGAFFMAAALAYLQFDHVRAEKKDTETKNDTETRRRGDAEMRGSASNPPVPASKLSVSMSPRLRVSASTPSLAPRPSPLAWYLAAIALFAMALLAKTVTVTLPAALLVVLWWKRGRLSWRRDVLPLLPLFAMAVAAGLVTRWVEHEFVGAEGAEFQLTPVERCLVAGRAVWFYLGKLLWPVELSFVYPRWTPSAAAWWQYVFPLAAVALGVVLWSARNRGRGPLAAYLLFVGMLFPVLGFFNVYMFFYSFVANRYLYLPSLGVIALGSAGMAGLWRGSPANGSTHARAAGLAGAPRSASPGFGTLLGFALLAVLALLTWQESKTYSDQETHYRTTVTRNPDCWMFQVNLGQVLTAMNRFDEAIGPLRKALAKNPECTDAHTCLANALRGQEKLDEAAAEYRETLRYLPNDFQARLELGILLLDQGKIEEAKSLLQKAISESDQSKVIPDQLPLVLAKAHCNLGICFAQERRYNEAVEHCREALKLQPRYAGAKRTLGAALLGAGRREEGKKQLAEALLLNPRDAAAACRLADALMEEGAHQQAAQLYQRALRANPRFNPALMGLKRLELHQ